MAALQRNRQASFTSLQDGLGFTAGNLHSHAAKLEEVGFIESGRSLVNATFEQVYFNGRIADIIALKDEEVVAVELKLSNYREAHRQAVAYQVGCHRSFVGLPLESAVDCLRRHRHEFDKSGAGLLGVNMPA